MIRQCEQQAGLAAVRRAKEGSGDECLYAVGVRFGLRSEKGAQAMADYWSVKPVQARSHRSNYQVFRRGLSRHLSG